MSRRVLVVEPDAAGRTMMERTLASAGLSTDATSSARDARAVLDRGDVEVVVIDELAGSGAPLDEVRWLREVYPSLLVIVTGALLSKRVMLELVRLGATDALAKPFTPVELRASVLRATGRLSAHREVALEFAASITEARRAIARGALVEARPLLARAQASSPLDAEVMALHALVAELEGRDGDADRAYRAAIALRDEEGASAPDPHEGLARLAAYRGARPTIGLGPERRGLPLRVVTDATAELGVGSGDADAVDGRSRLVMLGLGLCAEESRRALLSRWTRAARVRPPRRVAPRGGRRERARRARRRGGVGS